MNVADWAYPVADTPLQTPVHAQYPSGTTVIHGLRIVTYVKPAGGARGNRTTRAGLSGWLVLVRCETCGSEFVTKLRSIIRDTTACADETCNQLSIDKIRQEASNG